MSGYLLLRNFSLRLENLVVYFMDYNDGLIMSAALVNVVHALRGDRNSKDAQSQWLKLIYVGVSVASLTD